MSILITECKIKQINVKIKHKILNKKNLKYLIIFLINI